MNCIPDRALAGLDLRYPGPWTAGELMDICRAAFGDSHRVSPTIIADPTRLNPDPRFVELAEAAYGHPVLRARESGGSDARFFHRLGIPVIMTRPLMGQIHSAREWIDIQSMVTFYGICRDYLIERLSGAVDS